MTNKQIIAKLKKAKNIAIFAHRDPDPDACGAMFGLSEFCRAIGKEADVFVKKTKEKYLDYIFPLSEAKEDFVAENFDTIVLLDLHEIARVDKIFHQELYRAKELGKNFMIIDHHLVSKSENFDFKNFRIKDVASCSQMLVDLYKEEEIVPTKDASTYIYAGIMGDTDRFLHNNLTKEVFESAIYLQENGADIQHVYDYLYRYKTKNKIKMNKYFLDNLKFLNDESVGYIVVSEKDRKKIGVDREDVKSFSNEMITIKGIKLSFLCYERENNEFKISMRSLGDLNLVDFAMSKGGGGHKNSSGFQISNTNKKKIEKLIPIWVKEILNDK